MTIDTLPESEVRTDATPDGAGPEVESPQAAEAREPTPPNDAPTGGKARIDRRRLLFWTGAALVVGLIAFLVLRPTPVPVEVGEVVRGPLETVIETDGTTRVVDRYTITAPVSGRLARIDLREGDIISPGEVVARLSRVPLDPNTRSEAEARLVGAQAALRETEARLDQTRGAMEQAALRAERMRNLAEAGGVSQEAMEMAVLESRTAEREHAAARSRMDAVLAEIGAARAALMAGGGESVAVRSPEAGRLLRIHDPSERVVAAGTPLMDIGETRRLEVVAEVLSNDAVRIPPGARMRVAGWGGDELGATVRLVEPGAFTKISALGVEEQRVRVVGDLLSPPAALGDGYRIEARIVTWSADDVVKVPASALFRTGDDWSVFVIEGGRAHLREVLLGERTPREAEVVDGLQPGDAVILYPSERVEDGTRVRAQ